jgi:hypothetical protein
MIIASVTPYIVFPLAGLLWVDALCVSLGTPRCALRPAS